MKNRLIPAVQYKCCNGSAASGERDAGGRAALADVSVGFCRAPLLLCGAEVHSLEAGNVHQARPVGFSV